MVSITEREVMTLFEVVKLRLELQSPGSLEISMALFSNSLNELQIDLIREGLQSRLSTVSEGYIPSVCVARDQTESEAASLLVTFSRVNRAFA